MMTTTCPDVRFSVTDSILSSCSRCAGEAGEQEDDGGGAEQPTQPRTDVRRWRQRGPPRSLSEELVGREEPRPLQHVSARADHRGDTNGRDLDRRAAELDGAEAGQGELLLS